MDIRTLQPRSDIPVHTDITNQDYCHQCDKIYLIKSDIQVHTDITNQDYCHQCDKIYLTKSDIQVHTDISHQDYCHIGDTSYKTNFNMVHVDRVREQDVRLPFLLCFTQPINEEDVIVGVDLPLSSTPDSGWAASNLLKLSIS